jgi:hypothetical protein
MPLARAAIYVNKCSSQGENMNIRRLQGLALFIGAVCLPFGLLDLEADYFRYLGLIGILLFLFGIPAINASQPSGPIGWIAIILIALAAVIAFGFRVGVFGDTGFDDPLIATSVIAALAGRMITGWLTIIKKAFSPWLGWGLLAVGVVNLTGSLDLGSLGIAISIALMVVDAAVLAVYGIQIFRQNESGAKVKLVLP